MHEAALAQAALPAPVRCLGKSLRPYSIGHELWLLRESNSTMRGSIDGLPAAVLICSHTWSELKSLDTHRWMKLDLALWRWRMRRVKYDLKSELAKFLAYRDSGLLEFPVSDIIDTDRAPSRMPGAPFILRLQQWLMGAPCRLSESAAWDYPVGLAKMRWATYWESEGCFKVLNANEAEFDEFIKKQAKPETQ